MNINFESYKVFYHAAKHLSFSKAASILFITQSAISQSIKQLESNLETQLFLRHGRTMELTPDGEVLFKHIEQAYHLITSGEKQLHSRQNLDSGELKIGASDTICKYYLLPYIKKFHNKYPGIKLQIVNRPSPVVHDLVEKGEVEIGIVNILPKYNNEKLNVLPLIESADVFVASHKYLELSHGTFNLDELTDYPLISLGKNSTTRLYFNRLVKKHNLNYEPEIELGSIDLILEMVKIGLGIGFVSDYAAKEEINNQSIFQIKLSEYIPKRKLGIVSPSKLPLSAAAKAFSKLLSEEI